tara:strand:- start:446 stop:646 length:201 start_codon:yes stop_codon:yes gene_type:complete
MKKGKGKEDFKPHLMFEPKTGKSMMADSHEEHLIFKELGLVHEDELDMEGKDPSFQQAVESALASS